MNQIYFDIKFFGIIFSVLFGLSFILDKMFGLF